MNMFLHNINDAQVALEDTIQAPQFVDAGYVKKFDRVIANPPFSQNYSREAMEFPQRFRYGFTPEKGKKADLMFAQHMIASLNDKGLMATVMPHGVLFRGGAEKAIREGIIRANIIEAVISLPPNLFYGTGIPACILVINKSKPKNLENSIFFINADGEFGEGRAQNYLRPEDIEKITFVFENKLEVLRYSRLVGLDEIEKHDFSLNIRQYVDNSPDPEIEDVRGHLLGGIPKREVALYDEELRRYGLTTDIILDEKDRDYCLFKSAIGNRQQIREIIDAHVALTKEDKKMDDALNEWWEGASVAIEKLPHHNRVANFRRSSIIALKEQLAATDILDQFQRAGVFVNWWERVRWDLKTIVATGWVPSLIPNEHIKNTFFKNEMTELDSLEGNALKLEAALAEKLDEVEMAENDDDENGKTAKGAKSYLKEQIENLKDSRTESAQREKKTFEGLLSAIESQEKDLKAARKIVKQKEEALENKIEERRTHFTENEAKDLILTKLYDVARDEMYRYLNTQKRSITAIFENLWNKYRVPLNQLRVARDDAAASLDDQLTVMGYLKNNA
jgi:type I restriction enzyme M protein